MSTLQRRDPHTVLGVERGASSAEVKAAYLKLALQHHPDRNPTEREEAETRFKEVAQAWTVLADANALPSNVGKSSVRWSHESAERLFWRLYGMDGEVVGGHSASPRRASWQRYARHVDTLDETTLISGGEARSLYRKTLRELRGVEADTAASVREEARARLVEHKHVADAARLRSLLIDGRHQLDMLRSCLGVAIIRPEWALRAGLHATRRDLELEQQRQCALAQREAKERQWASFVETKLRPTWEAIEATRAARVAALAASASGAESCLEHCGWA
jgi:hypothetical protein